MILHPIYRAVFSHPIGPLNPMNLNLPAVMRVEIYQAKGRWQARCCDFSPPRPFPRLPAWGSAGEARNRLAECFTNQVEPWETWARDDKGVFRRLHPAEVVSAPDGKLYLKEPDKGVKSA